MVNARRGTVTVLFTDIVGSTELMQRLGDDYYHQLRGHHMELLRTQVHAFQGEEFKSEGDAIMVVFASAVDGVGCAVAMQQAIHRHHQEVDEAEWLPLRVGLDVGEPIREGGDYHGTPVVVASRLANDAAGGQILVSQLVRRLVGSRGGYAFRELEPRPMKGISEAFSVCEVEWEPDGEEARREAEATERRSSDAMPVPPILETGQRTGFVGRDRELRALRKCWKDVQAGQRRLFLLAGEPGIGKTRMAAQFARLAHAEHAVVLYGQCHEEGLLPYQPFVEALHHYILSSPAPILRTQVRADGPVLARLIPELARRLPDLLSSEHPARSLPNPVQDDPESERYWFFEAVASLLVEISRDRPLVIILDDLHWADAPTLQLLKHIIRTAENAPLLLLGTYREGELKRSHPLAETLADLRRDGVFERVSLEGLAEGDIEAMIAGWAGQEVPANVVDVISKRTEGNPFFIQEVLANLWETSAIEGREDQWASRLTTSIEEYGIPESIKEVIGRRCSRLSDPCNAMLAVASVIGREFEFAVLERVSDHPTEQLLDLLDEAIAAGVLAELPRRSGWYGFTHPLVRETLYGELTTARRVRMHGAIGEALEELAGGSEGTYLSELAHHFFEAVWGHGDIDKAVRYARRAGERARTLFAYEEAAQHYDRALQALELMAGVDEEDRFRLLLEVGTTFRMAGDSQKAADLMEQAISIARELKSPDLFARAVLSLRDGFVELGVRGPDETYVALLHEALEGLGERDDALRAGLLGYLAGEYYMSPDEEQRLSLSREAVEMARRAGDPETLAFTLIVRHYCIRSPNYAEERAAAVEEILGLAQQIGARGLALSGYASRIEDLLELGDIEAADEAIEIHARLSDESQMHRHLLHTKQLSAMRSLLDGSFDDAEKLADEALVLGQRARSRTALAMFSIQTFLIRKEQGRLHEIDEPFQVLAERYSDIPSYRAALTLLHCELGRPEEARREFDRLASHGFADIPRDTNWIMPVVYLAEACTQLRDAERAGELYELLLGYRGNNVVVGYGAACFGPASRYLGLLAATMSRWEDADRHFDESDAMCRRMGATPWLAHTQADRAGMLLARHEPGDREQAGDLLSESLNVAEALGMDSLAGRVRSLKATA